MAKIPVYEAPTRELHAEEKGFAAQETAGRRIGPAFDRAATDIRDVGNVTASISKERLWPWDILELDQRLGESGSGNGRGGGSGGFRVAGGNDSDPFGQFRSSGVTGRLGHVAAQMASDFTRATPTHSASHIVDTAQPQGANPRLTNLPDDNRLSRIIGDPRPLSPITFPDKRTPGSNDVAGKQNDGGPGFNPANDPNAVTIPRGREEQPSNPDALRREAEQSVFEMPLPPLPGYDSNGYNQSPSNTPDAPPSTSFGQQIWNGINAAAEWIGGSVSGTDTEPTPTPTEDQ